MDSAINSIVLASSSPRRLELLRSLNLDVRVVPSTYEEPEHPHLSPRDLSMVHARVKCEDVVEALRQAAVLSESKGQGDNGAAQLVVAADTVVDLDSVAYGKPKDVNDAKGMLQDLSGRTHIVHTAFALWVPKRDELLEHCESTFVTFFPLDEAEIDTYVASGEPMDKAGAYGIQGYGATLVERIEGDFYTVMGFPLARFARMLQRLGFLLPITKTSTTKSP